MRADRAAADVMRSAVLRWSLLALVGLALTGGISFGVSRISSQRIGLASEPLSAGSELAPRQGRVPARPPVTRRPPVTPRPPGRSKPDERGESPDGDD